MQSYSTDIPKEPTSSSKIGAVSICVFVLVITCVGGYFFWHRHTINAARTRFQELTITSLKEQVIGRLTDPDSANFRKLNLYRQVVLQGDPVSMPGGSYTVCGEVNAKNRLGGYVGYRRFVSTTYIDQKTGLPSEGTSGVFIEPAEGQRHAAFDHSSTEYCKGFLIKIEP